MDEQLCLESTFIPSISKPAPDTMWEKVRNRLLATNPTRKLIRFRLLLRKAIDTHCSMLYSSRRLKDASLSSSEIGTEVALSACLATEWQLLYTNNHQS
jgi:hypothetical protein